MNLASLFNDPQLAAATGAAALAVAGVLLYRLLNPSPATQLYKMLLKSEEQAKGKLLDCEKSVLRQYCAVRYQTDPHAVIEAVESYKRKGYTL